MNIAVSTDNAGAKVAKELEELFPGIFAKLDADMADQIRRSEISDLFIQHHMPEIRMMILNGIAMFSEEGKQTKKGEHTPDGDSTVAMFIFMEALRMYTLVRASKYFQLGKSQIGGDGMPAEITETMAILYTSDGMKKTLEDVAKMVEPCAGLAMRAIINSVQHKNFG